MKKGVLVLLSAMVAISMVGCSSGKVNEGDKTEQVASESSITQEESSSEKVESAEPLDLTGLWVQEDAENDSYMAAEIREDGKIGIFFVLKENDTPQTYWVGTYDAPADSVDEYSWISENTFGGISLLASSADTKEFTYKDGKITYEVTVKGNSRDVNLIRGEWDNSNIPDSAFGSVKASQADFKNIEIADSGWIMQNEKFLMYYVVLHNPNENTVVEYPSFRITARDGEGNLLETTDQTLSVVYPGQDFFYGSQAFSVDTMPDSVEFEMLDVKDYNLKDVSIMPEFKQLEVVSINASSDKLLGEISNPNDYDLDQVVVVAIYKNASGEVIGIENTYVNDVKAGTTTPFSAGVRIKEEIGTVECYANEW